MVENQKTTTVDMKRNKADETTLFAFNDEAKRRTAMADKTARLKAQRKEAEAVRLKAV